MRSPVRVNADRLRAVVAVVAVVVLLACTGDPAPQASQPPTSTATATAPAGTATPSTSATPPLATPNPEIRPEFFGLHIHNPRDNWPEIPWGSIRLWDSGVSWKQMAPSRGTLDFSTLDEHVKLMRAARKEIVMVLGVTPRWAASDINAPGNYGPGSASPPKDLKVWGAYVKALAERYKGKIDKWEIWNEPNVVLFWGAEPEAMLPLAKEAYTQLKAVDSRNIVLTPGIAVRTENSPLWLDEYLAAGGGQYADVIAAHFYVRPGQRPEHLRPSIDRIRGIMAKYGQADKPLWNTESGFGRRTPLPAEVYVEPLASAYVVRALAIFAGHQVERVHWYAWDDHGHLGLDLSEPDSQSPSPAGKAFGLMSKWLVGARGEGCTRFDDGLSEGAFRCQFTRGDEGIQILWHPGTKVPYEVPPEYRSLHTIDGKSAALPPGNLLVSAVPVMISTVAA